MKKVIASLLIVLLLWSEVFAFCGFYVAGAGAKLYNKSSQVIIARDGEKTVVTMESDFSGDVKQFAMVVPVPTVLKKEQIRVLDGNIFEKLDKYSAPRIVEYYDDNPCERFSPKAEMAMSRNGNITRSREELDDADVEKKYKVKIEAQYEIGEYSILILSAEESDGLTQWLMANKYAIPQKANEVLEPYIKNKLKFFVVKVNLQKMPAGGFTKLRPIQLEYEYEKFMLPIRLGMANAESVQDLTIYAFSRKGRIESSNYRTVEMPTARNVPMRIKDQFPNFYKAVFDRFYNRQGKTAVFVEYAWDISSENFVMCDPCPSTPPAYADLKEAGVFWVKAVENKERWSGNADYIGNVYITRMHVRYDRTNFPDDLGFFHTPNKENYQARYIVTHDAKGDLSCPRGKEYIKSRDQRHEAEEMILADLTGWKKGTQEVDKDNKNVLPFSSDDPQNPHGFGYWLKIAAMALGMILIIVQLPRMIYFLTLKFKRHITR
jgi:hypothetical protein